MHIVEADQAKMAVVSAARGGVGCEVPPWKRGNLLQAWVIWLGGTAKHLGAIFPPSSQ